MTIAAMLMLGTAFIFNAFNAVYYYTVPALAAGLGIIAICMALWAYDAFTEVRNSSNGNRAILQIRKGTLIAMALAEVMVLVPDLSFEYVKTIYINSTYAAIMCLVIIFATLIAHLAQTPKKNYKRIRNHAVQPYISIAAVFFGLLGLYSLSFYSGNAYLNSQAFTGAMLFMNEGLLFMLISIVLSFA